MPLDKQNTMTIKRRIALGLCWFLTLAPFIGSCFSADNTLGKYIGNLTPYIHLTMSQLDGFPFAEAIGGLIGIIIFLTGLVGSINFIATKFKRAGGLLLLLYITVVYSGLRALGALAFNVLSFNSHETNAKIFIVAAIISDIAWGMFCYWATTILSTEELVKDRQDEKHTA